MRKWKRGAAALLAAGVCLLTTGCSMVDESVLNTQADYSVSINVPYATATPLPDRLNVPDAIVIGEDGKVSVNDASAIEGDFQNQTDESQQSDYQSLNLGNTGTEVQALQARLQALGYFEGEVSGVYDASTEEAVKRFERTYGTMQTGVATSKLQLKLFAAGAPAFGSEEYESAVVAQYSVLRVGNVGSSVYALQQRLKDLGYPIGELDGVYDEETAKCVSMFYTTYGLAASKVASVSMQKQLYAENAKAYNASAAMPATLDTALDDEEDSGDFDTLEGQTDADEEEVDDFAELLEEAARQEAEASPATTAAVEQPEDDDGTLREGSTGERVRAVQQRLAEMGYLDKDAVSGTYDAATVEAVDRYLLMQGLGSESDLTPELEEKLLADTQTAPEAESDDTPSDESLKLNVGDSGTEVLALQNRLIELGYAAGSADGKYGPATITAVRAFQIINDLEADGVAGEDTLKLLNSDEAVSYADGKSKLPTPSPSPTIAASDTVFYKLSSGAAGSAVTKLQKRLIALGYLSSGKDTGSYDKATIKAVKAYQKAIGLKQTGVANASFQVFIYSKVAPKKGRTLSSKTSSYKNLTVGSKGNAVVKLQKRLCKLGYMTKSQGKKANGKYNETTRKIVAKLQRKMGFAVASGEATPEFQAYIYSKYGAKL